MLLSIISGEAVGIAESVPGGGFEAWRLLSVRINSVGEMYTFGKVNAIMKQTPARSVAELLARIVKVERDLKTFRKRTETVFPETRMKIGNEEQYMSIAPSSQRRELRGIVGDRE